LAYFNEKARKHAIISQTEHFPRGDAAIRKCHRYTPAFVQLAKDDFGLLKKKKKFYDFCVRCHIETEESANQSKGCDAKLKGL
jgi:hypothetical protein